MKTYVVKLFRRAKLANLVSADFSIGTGSAFVLVAAALGLVADRPAPADAFARGWTLRGALAPAEGAPPSAPAHAAALGVQKLG